MSKETLEWLNNNTLIGYTDSKGKAWHYSETHQGDEPNHYAGAIPTADVHRRLFHWSAIPVQATYTTDLHPQNGPKVLNKTFALPEKVLIRSDNGAHLGSHGEGYEVHQYGEWLIENVMTMLDVSSGELGIGSAILLQNGAIAAVQLELPETITVGNDEVRPFLTATTSHNGKYPTSYKRGIHRVVCDNTLEAFHADKNNLVFKVKHTKNSRLRMEEARRILELNYQAVQEEVKAIENLTNQVVTDEQFWKIVDLVDPVSINDSKTKQTLTENKRNHLDTLWNVDPRVAPYKGTAWGVVQAYNTYNHHLSIKRTSSSREERNYMNFLSGKTGDTDRKVVVSIKKVTGALV